MLFRSAKPRTWPGGCHTRGLLGATPVAAHGPHLWHPSLKPVAPSNVWGSLACLMARAQLNIKIDPELLQKAKAHATRQGKTLTEFLTEVLEAAVSDAPVGLEDRIARIEKHLGL